MEKTSIETSQKTKSKQMWNIHGKKYDLSDFMNNHPGGKSILEACRGDNDCTATFESYHAMCDRNKIISMMKKYEIGEGIKPLHSFHEDGFYRTVQNRVRNYFGKNNLLDLSNSGSKINKSKQNLSHHFNMFWCLKCICLMPIYIVMFYFAFFSNFSQVIKLQCSVIAAITSIQIMYIVLHDASHNAISKNNFVNDFLSRITCSLFLWDHQLWKIHHVYRHHSFTNDPKLDPDTMHLRPFVKKHQEDKETKFIKLFRRFPKTTTVISTILFPGIYVGQSISYHLVWLIRNNLWGMRLPESYTLSLFETILKLFVLYIFYYSANIPVIMSYLITINMSYFLTIMPDHDMIQTSQNKILSSTASPKDWGEYQVRNSGNYAMSNYWLTELYGGINYQIEHHLFPTICHVHYRAISPIVKETCKEFNIPYVQIDSVYDAVKSVLNNFGSIEIESIN